MTEKQLRKLKRVELLEMLIEQTKKVSALEKELEELRKEKDNRELVCKRAGSLAEASLQVSGIFATAQEAADVYLENIKKMEAETVERCRKIEATTKRICDERISKAEMESRRYWDELSKKLDEFYRTHPGLRETVDRKMGRTIRK